MSKNTSWDRIAGWYDRTVQDTGHYYHEHIILPRTLKLLNLRGRDSILDLGCGQGVLGRQIPADVNYLGIDVAKNLVEMAQKRDPNPKHEYRTGDVAADINLGDRKFTHAAIILALQNVDRPEMVLRNAAKYLQEEGKLLIVLNHPAFRIPRQSAWEIDSKNKMEFRRINRYLSPLKIPITAHPRQERSPITWSFHYLISDYFRMLNEAGFVTLIVEEWASDKESQGRAAKMENRARSEFPLFLTILAKKGPVL